MCCSLYLCYQMSALLCYQRRVTLREENCNRPDFRVCKRWFQMICDSLSDVKTTITHKNGYERSHCFLYDRPTCLSDYLCVCLICVGLYLLSLKGVQLKKKKSQEKKLTNLHSTTLTTHTQTHLTSTSRLEKYKKDLQYSSLNPYGV